MGDWWTPIVMREFLAGPRKFDELQARLEVSRATLSQRLERLVAEGLLMKEQYQPRPPRYVYQLTDKGLAFWSVLAAMWQFGSDWMFGDEGPVLALKDRESGRRVEVAVVDWATGEPIEVGKLRLGRTSAKSSEHRNAHPERSET
jgi:DNA-binding HxlR family transcriptional regulator